MTTTSPFDGGADLLELCCGWDSLSLWMAERFRGSKITNRATIEPVPREVHGRNARLWARRWRLFFLATAGLFGHRGGEEWGVSHYRLRSVAWS